MCKTVNGNRLLYIANVAKKNDRGWGGGRVREGWLFLPFSAILLPLFRFPRLRFFIHSFSRSFGRSVGQSVSQSAGSLLLLSFFPFLSYFLSFYLLFLSFFPFLSFLFFLSIILSVFLSV